MKIIDLPLKYVLDYIAYRRSGDRRFDLKIREAMPMLFDSTGKTTFDRHYVYHPAWAARIIKRNNPKKHIDISSTLYFCSILSAFVPVDFFDYRPANLKLSYLSCKRADLLSLPFDNSSVESLSCMHTVEHIGLGRYGDIIDPDGDIKAIKELIRVLKKDGSLLFVVPIGVSPLLKFNAHRIYTVEMIKKYFSGLKLEEFVMIPESEKDGGLVVNPKDSLIKKQRYACGCFWFKKLKEG